jgi:hypothetical protein
VDPDGERPRQFQSGLKAGAWTLPHDAGRLEPRIDRENGAEDGEKQRRFDEQHEGKRDLRGSEQSAQPVGRPGRPMISA